MIYSLLFYTKSYKNTYGTYIKSFVKKTFTVNKRNSNRCVVLKLGIIRKNEYEIFCF